MGLNPAKDGMAQDPLNSRLYFLLESSPLMLVSADRFRLWEDTQFSDATIIMGEKTWQVHRWVLCKQSNYFMKALEGSFKVECMVPTSPSWYQSRS